MALGMYGPDTEETREALMAAADDEDCDVRGEAIEALARRDPMLALPLVERDLARPECGYGVFEAAGLIADPSLVEALRNFDRDTDPHNSTIRQAIRACEAATPVKAWQY
jgi:HEAT repeat protein